MSASGRGSTGNTSPSRLHSIRYEDLATHGVAMPPLPRYPSPTPSRPSSSASYAKRPRTSPHPRASALSSEVKRDSGIAPFNSSAGRASYVEIHQPATAAGASREPSLPTIVIHDDEPIDNMAHVRTPFGRRTSKETRRMARSQSPPRVQRVRSFRGIDAVIPSSSLGDIDLHDLTSDKVGFSQRGSLLFGGKKMTELITARGDDAVFEGGDTTTGGASDRQHVSQSETTVSQFEQNDIAEEQPMHTNDPQAEELGTEAPKKQGLVAGPRNPSVHMLEAAFGDGSRALSTEEITFSMKVRSMYDYGNERAADRIDPGFVGTTNSPQLDAPPRDISTPTVERLRENDQARLSASTSQLSLQSPSLKSPTTPRQANLVKGTYELAGGIEDWEDINWVDVDRYGFISPKRVSSRGSGVVAGHDEPLKRVATSLRVEADSPKRNRRRLSRSVSKPRSSHSVPPSASTRVAAQSDVSIRSFHSNLATTRTTARPFQSRDRRTLAEAAEMLNAPPGLADIAEQEDAGRTASLQKQREWQREEKWQKMARPIRGKSVGLGGGMRFDFDLTNPKVAERTWKGIPDRWRATAWHCFLATSAKQRGDHTSDEELIRQFHEVQELSSADDVQIDVDVPRTISMHIMFRRRYRGGQRLLFRVLHAISVYCPDTGYVQGMASLAATLLCYYDEENAFVMLVRLWKLRGLEQLFQSGFEGLFSALGDFEKDWLRGGDVAQKLDELGITSTAYGTRWYLTLFNMSVPFPAQLRIWDVFMLLGNGADVASAQKYGGADLDVLHATSAALIDAMREILLDSDFENAMKVLTSFVPIRDEDLLMRVARTEWKMRKKRVGGKVPYACAPHRRLITSTSNGIRALTAMELAVAVVIDQGGKRAQHSRAFRSCRVEHSERDVRTTTRLSFALYVPQHPGKQQPEICTGGIATQSIVTPRTLPPRSSHASSRGPRTETSECRAHSFDDPTATPANRPPQAHNNIYGTVQYMTCDWMLIPDDAPTWV
nr:tbc domain-containing protein [Quercus suber]